MTLPIIDFPYPMPYAPRINGLTAPFWSALAVGKLLAMRCEDCARPCFPPRRVCPGCGGQHLGWLELSGRAELYSSTTVHAAPTMFPTPFTLAIVDTVEGLRLLTRILDEEKIPATGSAVRLVVTRFTDGCLFAATGTGDDPPRD